MIDNEIIYFMPIFSKIIIINFLILYQNKNVQIANIVSTKKHCNQFFGLKSIQKKLIN